MVKATLVSGSPAVDGSDYGQTAQGVHSLGGAAVVPERRKESFGFSYAIGRGIKLVHRISDADYVPAAAIDFCTKGIRANVVDVAAVVADHEGVFKAVGGDVVVVGVCKTGALAGIGQILSDGAVHEFGGASLIVETAPTRIGRLIVSEGAKEELCLLVARVDAAVDAASVRKVPTR